MSSPWVVDRLRARTLRSRSAPAWVVVKSRVTVVQSVVVSVNVVACVTVDAPTSRTRRSPVTAGLIARTRTDAW